jgi:hypothetical protein
MKLDSKEHAQEVAEGLVGGHVEQIANALLAAHVNAIEKALDQVCSGASIQHIEKELRAYRDLIRSQMSMDV